MLELIQLKMADWHHFTARATLARRSCRNSLRLSVRPSVCPSHAYLWRNQTIHCRYVDTTRKGNGNP